MKTSDLTEKIEKLVHDHLAQVRAEATAAMERAFASTRAAKTTTARPAARRAAAKRRDPAVVAEPRVERRSALMEPTRKVEAE